MPPLRALALPALLAASSSSFSFSSACPFLAFPSFAPPSASISLTVPAEVSQLGSIIFLCMNDSDSVCSSHVQQMSCMQRAHLAWNPQQWC